MPHCVSRVGITVYAACLLRVTLPSLASAVCATGVYNRSSHCYPLLTHSLLTSTHSVSLSLLECNSSQCGEELTPIGVPAVALLPLHTSSPERRITQKEIIAGEERPKYVLQSQYKPQAAAAAGKVYMPRPPLPLSTYSTLSNTRTHMTHTHICAHLARSRSRYLSRSLARSRPIRSKNIHHQTQLPLASDRDLSPPSTANCASPEDNSVEFDSHLAALSLSFSPFRSITSSLKVYRKHLLKPNSKYALTLWYNLNTP